MIMKSFACSLILPLLLSVCLLSGQTFAQQIWQLRPWNQNTLCVASLGTGQTEVFLTPCNGDPAQNWNVTGGPLHLLQIGTGESMPCSNKCLTVGENNNGALVVQTDCDPTNRAQYWITAPSGNILAQPGYVWLQNLWTGKCITAEGIGGSNAYVDTYDCSTSPTALHQLWIATGADPAINNMVTYKNQAGGVNILNPTPCLEVKNGNPANGATTLVAGCKPGAFYQAFGYKVVVPNIWKNTVSGLCLDGGGSVSQAYQYPCTPTARNHNWAQVFYPNDPWSPMIYVVDLLSGLCLTMNPANLNDLGTAPCVRGNVNQQWGTIPVA